MATTIFWHLQAVFMILGQSAGVLARMAVENGVDLHDVTYDELKTKLVEVGQILE